MPKNKTHSGIKKRVKVTGTGKLTARPGRQAAQLGAQADPPHPSPRRPGAGRQGRRPARAPAARPLTEPIGPPRHRGPRRRIRRTSTSAPAHAGPDEVSAGSPATE